MSTAGSVGSRLRRERLVLGMSLRKVAQELGVSASLISQVETGKTQPSVATLYALASLLSISVDDLLGLKSEQGPSVVQQSPSLALQHSADNPVIEMENGVRWERLAMGPDGPADALLVTYQPEGSSSLERKLMRHVGVEYAYVLSCEITLQLEFDTYLLGVGDSIYFDSSRPHMFANHGAVPAVGVWFVVGRRELNGQGGIDIERRVAVRSAVEVLQRLDSLESDTGQHG
ncbi:helix-turn-helix domain-containing protein [Arthrobacter sp. MI7-26]|uniref:helix-turn-helix domain-containing protein n=1 Tax=Arthrobacter sp. MI7-26 TaxID=2993653 RepID=UPI00224905FA|nr:helix-turn-helix domain-containing protein [Arthrobacter sp. MI7-26]MCX2749896.1 helix-turn-helix domain-containing protein [Arthrobacter sp. MI7-26]